MKLTDRQRALLDLLSMGKRPKQIAQEIGITCYAFHSAKRALLKKFGTRTLEELMFKYGKGIQ